MKILPIINKAVPDLARNKNVFNKSMLIAPMLLAISTPETLAKDVFNKEIVVSNNPKETSESENFFDYSRAVDLDKNNKNEISEEKALKKISKLEAKQNKYKEKLREKENSYNLYNIILKAMNGDKDSKNKFLKHVQENSSKRDIALFAGTGIAGVALSMVLGPAALLISISSFFTTNTIDNYIVDKKTNPKQKQEVVKEIKKLEDEIKDIKNNIKTIEFKISELQ